MFLLWLRQLPWCGDSNPASVPPPAEGRSSPTNTPVFLPSSFVLPSFMWFCVFFSTGQVLLSTLSWCSACTSVSEGVFLMYLWREMYSMSTYSSAILFSSKLFLIYVWYQSICHLWPILKKYFTTMRKKKKTKRDKKRNGMQEMGDIIQNRERKHKGG